MIKNLKIIAVISALLFIGVIPLKAQFTPGNIVIERLGDAVYPSGTSNAVPIYLDEYTTTGTYVQTVALPTTTANGNYMITENGSAAKSALMSRSANGQYICISGYMDTINAVNVSNTSTGGPDFIPRNVATVDYNGNINSTTLINDTYSGGKIRSVASVDGTHFWTSGNSGAIRYVALGSIGNTTQITSGPTNSNALDIFNGQLYNTGDHPNTIGLCKVGSGLPTSYLATTATVIPADTNSSSPFQFVWLVLSPGDTICYVANQQSGGLVKYSLRNDSLIKCGGINGVYVGVTGTVNCAGNVELFYSTSSSTSSNSVLKYIDSTGYMGRMHTFSQPAFILGITNYFFKGIKFCPYQDLTITSSQTIAAGSYNNITISSGGVATLSGNIKIVGTLTVNSGGTLICGAHNVVGNSDFQNAFVLNSGATLEMGSAAGITASAASGNIQTCARVYSTGANYIYNGTGNQVTGNGLPATVNNLTIANTGSAGSDTVHLTAAVTVTNDLTITSGVLDVSSSNYSITVDSSFYNNASFSAEAGTV
ncbi:MAG TPA: hypothetical protein VK890_07335, partial [Bacteroidia bacterium]|nr:hypothetical protein [Bacteroidia bacterium]